MQVRNVLPEPVGPRIMMLRRAEIPLLGVYIETSSGVLLKLS
jgi:hypothetical protein